MYVIIVGGGRTGARLAEQLLAARHTVRVIDWRAEVIERLRGELPAEAIVYGDGDDPQVLSAAGIRKANVLVAVTGDDEDNLVACTLARFEFSVPRTIARINNPRNAWLFTDEMVVDVAVDQANLIAHLVAEEMSLGDLMTLLELCKGEYALLEEKVVASSRADGASIRDLQLPAECVIAAIIRKAELIVPRGDVVLQAADEVVALVHASRSAELARLLSE